MKTKKVEFSKIEEVLGRIGVSLETLYKAHTNGDNKKLSKLNEKLKKLLSDQEQSLLELENQKNVLREIQARILEGTNEAMYNDPALLNQWLNSRITEGNNNRNDINKGMNYKRIQDELTKVITEIKNVEATIENIKNIIKTKVKNSEAFKKQFASNYETLINNFCDNGKKKIQKIKVGLAGNKISLKSEPVEEYSLTLSDLSKLNKIAELFESMNAIDTKKTNIESKIDTTFSKTIGLKSEILNLDKDSKESRIKIDGQQAVLKKAKSTKGKYAVISFIAALVNLEKEDPVYQKLETEKSKQEMAIDCALIQIQTLFNEATSASLSIKEKKEKLEELTVSIAILEKMKEKLTKNYGTTGQNLINSVRAYLANPSISVNIGIEEINEMLNKTPYDVASLKLIKQ